MINIKFYKTNAGQEDELGNKVKSNGELAIIEGSISTIKSSILSNTAQNSVSYDVTKTLHTIVVPYSDSIYKEATKAEVDSIIYDLKEKTILPKNNKLMIYCQKVK
ncbi:MAG: hypothetical protein PHQ32_02415 [Firmicutes bacterium]|nr:hypothetical protein [Bacillota bacterium]